MYSSSNYRSSTLHRGQTTAAAAAGSSAGSLALLSLFPRSGEFVRHGSAPNWDSVKQDSFDLAQRATAWVKENPYQACAIAFGTVGLFTVIKAVRRKRRKKSGSRQRSRQRSSPSRKSSKASLIEETPSKASVATLTGKTLVVGSYDDLLLPKTARQVVSTADIIGLEKASKERRPSRTTRDAFKACIEIAGLQSIEAGLAKLKLKLIEGGQISTDMLETPEEKAAFALLSQILEDPNLLESRSELARLSRWFATFFPPSSGSPASPSSDAPSSKEFTSPFSANAGSTQVTCDGEECLRGNLRYGLVVDHDEEFSTMRSITCDSGRLKRTSSGSMPEKQIDSNDYSAALCGEGRISGGEALQAGCKTDEVKLIDAGQEVGAEADVSAVTSTDVQSNLFEAQKNTDDDPSRRSPKTGPSGDAIDVQVANEVVRDATKEAGPSEPAENGHQTIKEALAKSQDSDDQRGSSPGPPMMSVDVSDFIVTDVGEDYDESRTVPVFPEPWPVKQVHCNVDEDIHDVFIVTDEGCDLRRRVERQMRGKSEPPFSEKTATTIARMNRRLRRREANPNETKAKRRTTPALFLPGISSSQDEPTSTENSSITISHQRKGIDLAKIVSLPVCDLSSFLSSSQKGLQRRLSLTASYCVSSASSSSVVSDPKTPDRIQTVYLMKPQPDMWFSDGASSMAPSFSSGSSEDFSSGGISGKDAKHERSHQHKSSHQKRPRFRHGQYVTDDDTSRSIPKITELNDIGASLSLEIGCVLDGPNFSSRTRHKGGHGAAGQLFSPVWRAYHLSDVKIGFIHQTVSDSRVHNASSSSSESIASSENTLSTTVTQQPVHYNQRGTPKATKNPNILVVSDSEESNRTGTLLRGEKPDFVAAYDNNGLHFCLPIGHSEAPSSTSDESSSRMPLQSSWYSSSSDTAMHTSNDVSEDIASFETAVVHPFFSKGGEIGLLNDKIQHMDEFQEPGASALRHKSPLSLVLRGLVSPFLSSIIEYDEDEGDHLEAIHNYSDCYGKPWKGNEDIKTCAWEEAQLASVEQAASLKGKGGLKSQRSSAGADYETMSPVESSSKYDHQRPTLCHCPTPPNLEEEPPDDDCFTRFASGDPDAAAPAALTAMAFRCIIRCCEWIDAKNPPSGPVLLSQKFSELEQVSRDAFEEAEWTIPFNGCETYVDLVASYLCDPPHVPEEFIGPDGSLALYGFEDCTKYEISWLRNFGWKGREFKACRHCSFQTFVTGELMMPLLKINAWEGGMYPTKDLTNGLRRYKLEDWVDTSFMESGLSFKCPRGSGVFCDGPHDFGYVFKVEKCPTVAIFSIEKLDFNYFEFPDSMTVPEVIGFRSPRRVTYRLLAFLFEWKSENKKPIPVMCCKGGACASNDTDPKGWYCRSKDQEWQIEPKDSPNGWLATPEITRILVFYGSKPPTKEFLASFYERSLVKRQTSS